jgi:CheY-like chemotaxis protein
VILDHDMPEMDGADVIRTIRDTVGIEDTPIILLTSIDQPGSGDTDYMLGAQGYLVKPAPASELLNMVNTILSNQTAAVVPKGSRDDAAATAVDTEADTVAPGDRIDILIAEDNEVNRILVEQTLLDAGLTFVAVVNGVQAIDMYRQSRPRAVLMDVSMPVMDGYRATQTIREIEAEQNLSRTPIIGLTAHALHGDRENCLNAGMDDYLPKPISTAKLVGMIEAWITSEPEGESSTPTLATSL